jgi:ribose 5-phosphate isomerase B
MKQVEKYLVSKGLEVKVCANKEYTATDSYAEFAKQANKEMLKDKSNMGIYSCRTGIGICMAANRSKGIRAGVCDCEKTVFLARNDDDMNVLVLPQEFVGIRKAKKLIDLFLSTPFEGGRHIPRVSALDTD